ncbi:unnamed protein product [Gulo gulo]|uniref:Uncharacterized protein n=1 Tax=Gulo gulo TaxID=48420 RepID=A0A9X9PTN2_GULGU|nr:unnamed protein product [Gulo gulo]
MAGVLDLLMMSKENSESLLDGSTLLGRKTSVHKQKTSNPNLLVIESPHCLIGTRMAPQPDLKHLLKLVGTSALPFKNKNYIINCVK